MKHEGHKPDIRKQSGIQAEADWNKQTDNAKMPTRSIKEWQKVITEYAINHGFNWTPNDIDTMLLRIHSEVSEASEAARDESRQDLAEEMADIFIRLANASEVMGIDLESEVMKKHEKNLQREKLHGRKRK